MFRITVYVLAICFGFALASTRQSPHADLVDELIQKEGVRYSSNALEDAVLDVPGLVSKYGYPIEVYSVVTEDGYILEMHRIPHGRDNNNVDGQRPVVFVMHGFLCSSADFLILGPHNALGYLLAEAGFDVWFGNARGNYYSEKHEYLDPKDPKDITFWKFSWDQIGLYDLPAMIDRVLEITGERKLHYIGHSQGVTTFLVLNSLKPEYNDKFKSFHGLAPVAFFNHNEEVLYNAAAPFSNIVEAIAYRLGVASLFTNRDFFTLIGVHCADEMILQPLCAALLFSGDLLSSRNHTMIPVYLGHFPAGAALRQLVHYGQSLSTHTFRRFDYGILSNLVLYGTFRPPAYEVDKVTTPSYLHYALGDVAVNYKDALELAESLVSTVETLQVARVNFAHIDFIWADDATKLVYEPLIDILLKDETRYGE